MKKILSNLIISLFFLGSGEAFSTNCFDIEAVSDSIVGKLWNKIEVPKENIIELFELIEESKNNKNKKHKTKDEVKKIIYNTEEDAEKVTKFISTWKDLVLNLSEDKDDSEIIDQFINGVTKLQSKYSLDTIKDSLSIILDKY